MIVKEKTHFQACNLCEAICGLEIKTRGNEIVSIKGDKQDPLSQGHICPKAIALQDIYKDPDRLRQPVKRTADGWQSISWDEAFDEVVGSLKNIQKEYGNNAVAIYQGNPSVHSMGIMMFAKQFLKQLNTRNRFSATSVDQLPHHLVAALMFGHDMLIPIPDIDRTDFMVVMGANPIVSNGSMMTVPNVGARFKALRKRGGQLWVIDPRFSETAAIADKHMSINPGTDAYLLAAMMHVITQEYDLDLGCLTEHVDSVENLKGLFENWTPEKVADITGLTAASIRDLVAEFCRAERAVLYGRMGVSTQQFGTLCQWLIVLFNIVTNNFDKAGGAMFAKPAVDILSGRKIKTETNGLAAGFNRYQSRVKHLPELQGEFPVTTLADEIVTEGEGQVKALVLVAGNPVLSTPNGRVLDEALKNLDFIVAVDCYINESTRHANIILPPTTILERSHYDLVFHALAVRNTARFSSPVFKAPGNSRSDTEIFLELARRMKNRPGVLSSFKKCGEKLFLRKAAEKYLDHSLKAGPYGRSHGLNLQMLKSAKHGVDLGALEPCLPQRLFNAEKKIFLTPPEFVNDLERLQAGFIANKAEQDDLKLFPMRLIGRRDPRTCNSWMHNSHRLTKGKNRCVAHIHPDDVKRLNLTEKKKIRVKSATGEIIIDFESTDTIKPGVISIPHGWGHNLPGVKMKGAVEHAGVSINNITDTQFFDPVSGNAALNGVPVCVSI